MPTFFTRRYMRPVTAVSRTERTVGAFILLLLATLIGGLAWQVCSDRENPFSPVVVGEPQGADAPIVWRFPEVAGWQSPASPEQYAPDELYMKINGRADFYLQHHVVRLRCATYTYPTDPERTIDVYCYTMRTAADARAAYEAEKPPAAVAPDMGTTGYTSAGAVFVCVAEHYVQVLPGREDAEDAATAQALAAALCRRIADSGQP